MTDKPNYNDGNWHGWNGGECPVHPKSMIEAVYLMNDGADSHMVYCNVASDKTWNKPFLFRVIEEHREPREWWAFCDHLYTTEAAADEFRAKLIEKHPANRYETTPIIHVREVLP